MAAAEAAARARAPARSPAVPTCTRRRPTPRASLRTGWPRETPGPDGEIPVAVVGHGVREAVELFALRGAGEAAALRWTGCVPLPENAIGNDVWLDEAGALWVTNYQPALGGPARPLLHGRRGPRPADRRGAALARFALAAASASRSSGWESVPGTRGANPNGLLLMPGGAALAVAFTGSGSVGLRPLAPGGGPAREIEVGGHPDNLTLSSRATLLALVHTSGLASLRCRFGALPCASPWKLMEIDPATGLASERFAHDGSLVGGVASVAEVGERLYFGAVFDDRIGVRPRPLSAPARAKSARAC